jgi:thioredoxin 1
VRLQWPLLIKSYLKVIMHKILKFSANWCVPCSVLDEQMEKIYTKINSVEVQRINIENSTLLARQYNVRSIPTLIKVNSTGEEVCRIMGAQSDTNLIEFING